MAFLSLRHSCLREESGEIVRAGSQRKAEHGELCCRERTVRDHAGWGGRTVGGGNEEFEMKEADSELG